MKIYNVICNICSLFKFDFDRSYHIGKIANLRYKKYVFRKIFECMFKNTFGGWEIKALTKQEVKDLDFEWGVWDLSEWIEMCEDKSLIDYDGHGRYMLRSGEQWYWIYGLNAKPSLHKHRPNMATHVDWYNR